MSHTNKKTRGAVAAVAGLGLAVGMLPTVTASAAPDAGESAEPTISSEVQAELDQNGTADVWLELESQADLSAAYSMSWEERGHFVFNELRAEADRSQADLLAELDAAGADYQSFWITNSVFVEDASADLVEAVATADSGLSEIRADFTPELIAPVESKPTAAPQEVAWGVADVGAPEIWDTYGATGEGIVVGTFDTGVDGSHPALADAYRGTETGSDDYNWFDSTGGSDTPTDYDGHGTHVTGTMVGADGDNQIGVAPGAQWIGTAGCCVTGADVVETFEWFVAPTRVDGSDPDPDMRPDVINNSWGFTGAQYPGDSPEGELLNELMGAWDAAGIFGTWSAGNLGEDYAEAGMTECDNISSPSWNNGATYVVGNHQQDGAINPSSSRGNGEDGEFGVDIGAPGTDIPSAYPGGEYVLMTGTSMAAPHMAGGVALLWSHFPELRGDNAATVAALDAAAIDQEDTFCGGDAANNQTWGEGDLDLVALFESLEEEEPPPPAEGPEIQRVAGADRYQTADAVSDLFADGAETVYLASGENYPDAMSGAPAAAQGKIIQGGVLETPEGDPAPVLLSKSGNLTNATRAALAELTPDNVVILGGETVINADVEEELTASYDNVSRVEGENRYDTAAELAKLYEPGLPVVYVASGVDDAYPDALTGSALAGATDAPVLLTKSDAVPAATAEALAELNPANIVVIGGEQAVSPEVYTALGASERIAGDDRWSTAATLSAQNYGENAPVVYLADGRDFPDALAASSLAGSLDAPVLITKTEALPQATLAELQRLAPERVVIVGGPEAISDAVQTRLEDPATWE